LIGRVQAGGLTLRELEADLIRQLKVGFFVNPQLTVAIEQYRSQRVFVVGEVRTPGLQSLTGDMTLIEALARAGSMLPSAGHEAIVVRPPAGSAGTPLLAAVAPPGPTAGADRAEASPAGTNSSPAGATDGRTVETFIAQAQATQAELMRVDIRDLQNGMLAQNVRLRDGDTVFVPRASTMFVSGQVRNPGEYPVKSETTVLQALSLAGGVTDRGSTRRMRIVRLANGKRTELQAAVDDLVYPGDTIIVPERFF
jgi:polysaccharide export outer membrane protein